MLCCIRGWRMEKRCFFFSFSGQGPICQDCAHFENILPFSLPDADCAAPLFNHFSLILYLLLRRNIVFKIYFCIWTHLFAVMTDEPTYLRHWMPFVSQKLSSVFVEKWHLWEKSYWFRSACYEYLFINISFICLHDCTTWLCFDCLNSFSLPSVYTKPSCYYNAAFSSTITASLW